MSCRLDLHRWYRNPYKVDRILVSQLLVVAGFLIVFFAGHSSHPARAAGISFVDSSAASGLTVPHVSTPEKRYIVESMSGGAAVFDCDDDGYLDVAVANGSSVERFKTGGDPFITLYRQLFERDPGAPPKFENVTIAGGLARRGWGMAVTAVCREGEARCR